MNHFCTATATGTPVTVRVVSFDVGTRRILATFPTDIPGHTITIEMSPAEAVELAGGITAAAMGVATLLLNRTSQPLDGAVSVDAAHQHTFHRTAPPAPWDPTAPLPPAAPYRGVGHVLAERPASIDQAGAEG